MARRQSVAQSVHTVCAGTAKFRPFAKGRSCTFSTCKTINFTNTREEHSQSKKSWISEFKIMARCKKSTEDMVYDNYKYFRRPIVPFLVPKMQNVEVPSRFEHDILNDLVRSAQKQCYIFPPKSEPYKSVETQTDYRDSEAQTLPWEPPHTIKPGHNPEVLTIAHLTWEHGLPAGIHEVEIINRMRMRRAWEAILPPMDTPANIKMRTSIITALEIDEWAFRESEIQAIMDYRLRLMDEITQTRECQQREKIEDRFNRLKDNLNKRRDREINSIRHRLRRELRKLHRKHQEKSRTSKRDIISEHADPSSELYAPQMRFGEHPQRRHEVIRKELLKDTYVDRAETMDTTPNWLPTYDELKAIKPKPKPTDLCIRETRWTEEKLQKLHHDLKAIRLRIKPINELTLMRRKYRPPPLPSTPHRSCTENIAENQIDQFSTFLQKTIKGRAVQCMMFEGRDRCRELIEELQSTHALEESNKIERHKEKMQMTELQRLQNDRFVQEDRVYEILNSLEGMTVSAMLDFLSKELERLEDERRIHAIALLAERERSMREAAEAGRRQFERTRRRELDEMFRQIVKVHQDSVETYLEDIIKEGIEWTSEEMAKQYILELSDKVDSVSKYAAENATEIEQEEMVANMIYNFVLPEVEKHAVRKSIRDKQQSYLRNAHAAIYDKILELPFVEDSTSTIEEQQTSAEEISSEALHSGENEEIISGRVLETGVESPDVVDASTNVDIESEEIIKDLLESIISGVAVHRGSSLELQYSSSDSNGFSE